MPQTLALTYTPTLIEKVLGRNYKWWYIIVYHFKIMTAYRANTILWSFFGLISLSISLGIWYINKLNGSNLDFSELVTYIVIGNWYSMAINIWAQEEFGSWIKSGHLTPKLLYPSSFIIRYFVEFIGKAFLAEFFIKSLAYFLLIPILFSFIQPPSNWYNIALMLLFLPISFFIAYLIDICIGCINFWIMDFGAIGSIQNQVAELFKGSFIPLYLIISLSPWLQALNFQPFAFLLHHPMQIYLGKYNLQETLFVFAGGIVWCIALYFLAKLVFKLGLKKNESVGL